MFFLFFFQNRQELTILSMFLKYLLRSAPSKTPITILISQEFSELAFHSPMKIKKK